MTSDLTDLPLFEPYKAVRRADVDTSYDAAFSMEGATGRQHAAILRVMADRVRRAAEEIEIVLGFSIWRRLNELERHGLLVRTDEKHRNQSGREAYRYEITTRGFYVHRQD